MDPVSIGLTVASGIMGAAGSLYSGAAQSNMYAYQAGVARARARVDAQNARWAIASGEENALYKGMGERFKGSAILAGQGASNISVASPSSARVRQGQTEIAQMEQSQIRTNAARRAFGYQVEQATDIASGQALDVSAQTAQTAGYFGAASSILGMGSSVASKWTQASMSTGSGSPWGQTGADFGVVGPYAQYPEFA